MIKNFDETKKQLNELAPIINAFKSEAVQLCIIELVLQGKTRADSKEEPPEVFDETPRPGDRRASQGRKRKARVTKEKSTETGSSKRRNSANGPVPTFEALIQEGFFKKRQTIGQIVEHCRSHKARKFKPNEISGPLARFVRNGKLKRQKNAEGQFEYYA